MDHGVTRDYQLSNLIVIIIEKKIYVKLRIFSVTENSGSAALGFSPCYDCPIAYQLKVTNDEAQILLNGTVVKA